MQQAEPCGRVSASRAAAASLPIAISQAVTTAKQGLRNSEGCMVPSSGKLSQRRAPLVSKPITSVAAVSAIAPRQPSRAKRRTPFGDSSETITISDAARPRKTTCLASSRQREEVPMTRSATAGEAASIIM